MLVQELIKLLQKQPQNTLVVIETPHDDECYNIATVSMIERDKSNGNGTYDAIVLTTD